MRTKNSLRNAIIGVFSYLILMISSFVTRSAFISCLGLEMGGVEALFKNILSMLALAELGLGTGLVYKLYKPLAENDNKSIKKILNFYKKSYSVISAVILGIGFVLSFIVPFLIKEDYSKIYLGLLFFLYVIDIVCTYLFSNRKALIMADEKNYIINMNDASIQFFTMIFQVFFLFKTKSFFIYMIIKIICRLIGSIRLGNKFKKLYPEIYNDKSKESISGDERKKLLTNISAMLCHKIGAFSVNSSASIFVTYFVSVLINGIYANYLLIVSTVTSLINQIFNGITASFGNLLTMENSDVVYSKFNILYFFNFWIYAFCGTCIFVNIQPFITVWVGKASLFNMETVVLLLLSFYIMGIRRVVLMTKDSAGLFKIDKNFALLEAALNLILAFILVNAIGVNGVIIANIMSMLIIPFWTQPHVVYKHILHKSKLDYYKKYFIYFITAIIMVSLTYVVSLQLQQTSYILTLCINVCLCLTIPNLIVVLFFRKTNEFKSLIKLLLSVVGK